MNISIDRLFCRFRIHFWRYFRFYEQGFAYRECRNCETQQILVLGQWTALPADLRADDLRKRMRHEQR